jgi:HEAT repeat protein
VIPFLDHPDRYLQQAAAAALQTMPSPASVEALEGVLGDPSLELRGMAAISLSHLGSGAGATVLIDLIDAETYARARAADPSKYGDAALVQNNRIRAVEALARLGRSQDRSVFERLVADDRDPAVREAAMRALADRREETGG